MVSINSLRALGIGIALGIAVTGCSPTAGKSWGSGGGTTFRHEDTGDVSYGVERLTCDGRVYLVLAANGVRGSGGGGGDGTYRGKLLKDDGQTLDWSCTTQDTRTGKVVIDGREFELANGPLFLISTKESPARIEQLAIDPEALQPASDTKHFPDLAQADARVAEFLKSCRVSR